MSLRVLVVTQDDPFYMPLFFEKFLDAITNEINITEVTILQPFDESTLELAQRMYRLYGPVNFLRRGTDFGYRKLANILGASYSVPAVVAEHGIPLVDRQSVNTESFVSVVEENDIDVILSVAAPEIFDKELIAAPNWGSINVHTSELPKYRGMLPTFWALYHGETEIGVTVHTMADEVDRGQIVRQTTFPVDSASLDEVIKQGKQIGGNLAAAALHDIASDEVTLQPMNGEESYFSFPTLQERKEFQRRGGDLL